MEKYVVVDLETTGHASGKKDKIIEVGIVTIIDGAITEQYSTFLNPGMKIPPFISNLTGIHDTDVANAPLFEEVAAEIKEKFNNACLIAHNVPFDLGFLNDELAGCGLDTLKCPVLDTVELSRILHPQAPSYKLSNLAEYVNIQHDSPHRALADAYVTACLFLKLRDKLFTLPLETIKQLQKIEKKLKSNLSFLLAERSQSLHRKPEYHDHLGVYAGLAYKKINNLDSHQKVVEDSYGAFLDDLFQDVSRLHDAFGIYENRAGQREMADLIYDAFESKQHAIVEAGTGTGKTIGYLLPAAYEAIKRQERIIISTYTTQLQSQLLDEEIPILEKLMPYEVKTALLKGRYHYLSLQKFARELDLKEIGNYDIALSKAILLVWITETKTGDIDEIQLPSNGYHFYKRISAEMERHEENEGYFSYYETARQQAAEAHLVVTNHALLCKDLFSEQELIPSYNRCLIDEAHEFENSAARRFGLKLDYVQMQFVLNSIGTWQDSFWTGIRLTNPESASLISGAEWNYAFKETHHELDSLFRQIFSYVSSVKGKAYTDTGRVQCMFPQSKPRGHAWRTIQDMAHRLLFRLRDLTLLIRPIQQKTSADSEEVIETAQLIGQLEDFISSLEFMFLSEPSRNNVKWAEIEAKGAKNAVYLYSEPASVTKQLQNSLFTMKDSVVLTSATLTMSGSFNFVQERLGLQSGQFMSASIPSPYSYENQVQLLVPDDFPDVREEGEAFIYSLCEAVLSLAEITEGRMLVLFTSFDMLKKCHALLKEILEEEEFALIAQGITSGSRLRLKKAFQSHEKAILLGTSSFWEGIDIPGEDLSALVIARLPFQPPNHPLYEARSEQIEAEGKNPFHELSLPNAVIRFKQGFGRLIRSERDRGIVFVCDSRIIKSSYGQYFLNSIPKVPLSVDKTGKLIEKMRNWF